MTDTKAESTVTLSDAKNAPIIHFDGAPNFGCHQGIVNVTLCAGRHMLKAEGGIAFDLVVTAFLRCSIPAAQELRDSLDKALLIAATPHTDEKRN